MTAIAFAVQRFHRWIFGSQFKILSDNKALVYLLSIPMSKMTARIERMQLRLQGYNYSIRHIKGTDNPADFPSRRPPDNPTVSKVGEKTEEYIFLSST
jgi:hypothetical protein